MGFEPTISCIRGKRLTTRPQRLHYKDLWVKIKFVENFYDTQLKQFEFALAN